MLHHEAAKIVMYHVYMISTCKKWHNSFFTPIQYLHDAIDKNISKT